MRAINKILSFCLIFVLSYISPVSADITSDANRLFDWTENSYSQYFPSKQVTQNIDSWLFRFYPQTQSYVGVNVNDNSVYVFGGPWGNISPTFISTLPNLLVLTQGAANGKLTDIAYIASGDYSSDNHTLSIKNDGTVWAWGNNFFGQLGDGTTVDRPTPVQVIGLTDIIKVVKSGSSSYAIKNDGTIWAWGSNFAGQLGDGTTVERPAPVQVMGLTDVVDIVTNRSSVFALKTDGTVWAWGQGDVGLLGIETGNEEEYQVFSTPVKIPSFVDVVKIGTPPNDPRVLSLVAIKKDGTVWAMGRNRGNGTLSFDRELVQVSGLTDIISVDFAGDGDENAYALKADGTVWAWGLNISGELGNGTTNESFTPVQVSNLTDIVSIAAGRSNAYALRNDGTVWAWGRNQVGQLGDGTEIDRLSPVQVIGLNDIVSVIPNNTIFSYVLALKNDGTVWAWGNNQQGQLGVEDTTITARPIPEQIDGLSDVIAIAISSTSNHAIKNDGTVWTWGANFSGQLGDGTKTNRSTPIQVIDESN